MGAASSGGKPFFFISAHVWAAFFATKAAVMAWMRRPVGVKRPTAAGQLRASSTSTPSTAAACSAVIQVADAMLGSDKGHVDQRGVVDVTPFQPRHPLIRAAAVIGIAASPMSVLVRRGAGHAEPIQRPWRLRDAATPERAGNTVTAAERRGAETPPCQPPARTGRPCDTLTLRHARPQSVPEPSRAVARRKSHSRASRRAPVGRRRRRSSLTGAGVCGPAASFVDRRWRPGNSAIPRGRTGAFWVSSPQSQSLTLPCKRTCFRFVTLVVVSCGWGGGRAGTLPPVRCPPAARPPRTLLPFRPPLPLSVLAHTVRSRDTVDDGTAEDEDAVGGPAPRAALLLVGVGGTPGPPRPALPRQTRRPPPRRRSAATLHLAGGWRGHVARSARGVAGPGGEGKGPTAAGEGGGGRLAAPVFMRLGW